ncbi:glycosyltransferase [Salegentibacter mishustinae]|uniref:glycosyltransferase n=1 Tax=Salegentibacter mishustinae TaxID=270918 RepID=UPI001CE0CE80|nr:glycosyltransferase [Salegentibacter mishustinae]UBZ06852.1 glycosyltransferase [Salegentibacter mishustinae]
MWKKVFAVVVTYKRASILEQCLTAVLKSSTYKIEHLHIIVNDNESSTLKIIKQFSLEFPSKISFEIYDNVGPAGGFYYGLKKFQESKSDYVWLMDDDIIPEPGCLQALMDCADSEPYVFPKVVKKTGEEVRAFGWWGVLISKQIVEKAGLPIKDFFYWTEDTEYLQNRMIRKNGIIPYRCGNAVVEHLHKRTGNKPSWYYYYTIRNTLYYRTRIFPFNLKGAVRVAYVFLGTFYRILSNEPKKLKKMYLVGLGTFHGLAGKLGKIEKLHQEC